MNAELIAKNNQIFRLVNGSHLYGTAVETSDRDEVGVCIVPPKVLLGFQNFEQYQYSSGTDQSRNGPEDYDLTIYDCRKFSKLVTEGNPSLLNLLWAPEQSRIDWSGWADDLMEIRNHVHSRVAIGKFLGYMTSQIKRLKGEERKHTPNRPELVEKYGFDTKFAAHAIRLGYQGLEFSLSGKITLPLPDVVRKVVLATRGGEVSLSDVLEMADDFVRSLEIQKERTDIPKQPNREKVEEIVMDLYLSHWKVKGLI